MTDESRTIRIRIRLFARQREMAGAREVILDLATGATIEDAWAALVARVPAISPGRQFVRFARNGEYADGDSPLADGDEVACIPPISGGGEAGATGDDPVIRLSRARRCRRHPR